MEIAARTVREVPIVTGMYDARAPLAGRYRLLDEIGAGATGSVWRAWDLREGRHVAAKVLGRADDALLQRFVREQAVRVEHPHVVAPGGWVAADERVLLTMDLVSGGSLATLLLTHPRLPEGVVAELLDQLLQALVAVHAAGVVHRDVKPANLLLEATGDERPHLRLADFGVAGLLGGSRLTRDGPIGTYGWAAPEQERGSPPDPRQDLWAVGVLGRLLLAGHDPARPVPGAVRPRGRLGPLLDALAEPDPELRPATAAAALATLRRLGVPAPQAWPHVPDRLGPAPAQPRDRHHDSARLLTVLACLCFVAAIGLSAAAALVAT